MIKGALMDTLIMINWSASKVASLHPLIPAGRLLAGGLFWTGWQIFTQCQLGLEGEVALNVQIIKAASQNVNWFAIHLPSSLYKYPRPSSSLCDPRCQRPGGGGRGIIADRMRQDFLPTNLTICSTFENLYKSLSFAPAFQSCLPKDSNKSFVFCDFYLLVFNAENDTESNRNFKDYLFDQLSILLFPHWLNWVFGVLTNPVGFVLLFPLDLSFCDTLALHSRIARFTMHWHLFCNFIRQ